MAPATVLTIESTIPQGMTVDAYRRSRRTPRPRRRARRAAALVAAAACLAAAPAGASAAGDVSAHAGSAVPAGSPAASATFSPARGSARTTFRLSLRAPYEADGEETMYIFEAYGPAGCAASATASNAVSKGRTLVMRLRPRDVYMPTLGVSRWCRGSYIGNLWFQTPGGEANIFVDNVQFRVR